MSRLAFIIIFLSLSASFAAVAVQDSVLLGDPVAGKAKSEVCTACHGVDGNSPTPIWPKIAGLSQSYILSQLLEYQKGDKGSRNDPTMYSIVQNFNQQDLADLAAYFSSQEMTIGTAQQNLVALGQQIYRGGNILSGVPACAACHGATGTGNSLAKFPRLGGQNSAYIVDQLTKFKTMARHNDPNSMMENIAGRLTDKEIEAVASYVSGLH
jgi:cytochrome c553